MPSPSSPRPHRRRAHLRPRIAYGLGLVAAPTRLTTVARRAGVPTRDADPAARARGARASGSAPAAWSPSLSGAPVRPWLAAQIAGDLADIAATVGRNGIPPARGGPETAVGGGSGRADGGRRRGGGLLTAWPYRRSPARLAARCSCSLHTLGTDHRMWDPVIERLARERDVIAVDMPGFGGSPPLDGGGPVRPAAWPPRWSGFLRDELGVEHPHVAGNSLGGWVALELGAAAVPRGRHGDRARRACGAAGWRPEARRGARRPPRRAARAAVLMAATSLRRLRDGGDDRPSRADPGRRRVGGSCAPTRARPGFEASSNAMRARRASATSAEITVPVTLGWPELDRLVRAARRTCRRGPRDPAAGCGHLPTYDDPGAVARLLLEGSAG